MAKKGCCSGSCGLRSRRRKKHAGSAFLRWADESWSSGHRRCSVLRAALNPHSQHTPSHVTNTYTQTHIYTQHQHVIAGFLNSFNGHRTNVDHTHTRQQQMVAAAADADGGAAPAPAPAAGQHQHPKQHHPNIQISLPGYGVLMFQQAGALERLHALGYDLAHPSVSFVGSSAGALLAILSACGVDAHTALSLAHELCVERGVYARGALGLFGVWGGLVRAWLDKLLPHDAAARCGGGRVRVVVTAWPHALGLRRHVVSDFRDREDLIEAALASAHVPFVMDGRLTRPFRGWPCVDGSLLWLLTRRCPGLRPQHTTLKPPAAAGAAAAAAVAAAAAAAQAAEVVLLDPLADRELWSRGGGGGGGSGGGGGGGWSWLRCLLPCGPDGARALLERGAAHAAALEARGAFARLPKLLRRAREEEAAEEEEEAAAGVEGRGKCSGGGSVGLVHVLATASESSE